MESFHVDVVHDRYFSRQQIGTKFNIQAATGESDHEYTGTSAPTYMDALYTHSVNEVNVTRSQVNELEMWLNGHVYDSDVMKWDMKRKNASFCAKHSKNNDLVQSLISFVDQMTRMSSSFQFGFHFYYWDYYKTLETVPISHEWFNSADLYSYSPREMFVPQRHA
eukprot:892794_1